MKKIIKTIISFAIIICNSFLFNASSSVSAAPAKGTDAGSTPGTTSSYVDSSCSYLLGLTSWNCGVNINNEDTLKSGIWTIVANIAKDITVIAAYLVIGYVIYGGYLYIFSAGDPSKVASGKKTLTQAFIGLAIVMLANIIMDTIRFVLLGNGKLNCNPATGEGCIDGAGVSNLVNQTIQWFIGVGGTVSAVFVVLGGISLMTSNGDPGKVQKAKQTITYALIGLAIVGLSQIITAFVTNMIREAGKQSQFTNNTISTITKEQND